MSVVWKRIEGAHFEVRRTERREMESIETEGNATILHDFFLQKLWSQNDLSQVGGSEALTQLTNRCLC